jgi:hypothetical protein
MSEFSDDAGREGFDEPNDDFEICTGCGEPYIVTFTGQRLCWPCYRKTRD